MAHSDFSEEELHVALDEPPTPEPAGDEAAEWGTGGFVDDPTGGFGELSSGFEEPADAPFRFGYRERNRSDRPQERLAVNEQTFAATAADAIAVGAGFEAQREAELRGARVVLAEGDVEVPPVLTFEEMPLAEPLRAAVRHRYAASRTDETDWGTVATPTAVQCHVIPHLLSANRGDLLVRAPTGGGKTAAFLLPLIQRVHEAKRRLLEWDDEEWARANEDRPLAFVLTPTRELAIQIVKEANALVQGTDVRVCFAIGELNRAENVRQLKRGCDLVVGTMGRLVDFFFADGPERVLHTDGLQFVVLDEFDRLAELPDWREFERVVVRMREKTPDCRVLAFSATATPADHLRLPRDPTIVCVGADYPPLCVVQKFVDVSEARFAGPNGTKVRGAKMDYLLAWLRVKTRVEDGQKRLPRTLVFVRTRRQADAAAIRLLREGWRALSVHGGRSTAQRVHTVQRFKDAHFDVLVTTDLVARGLNVPDVACVLNFDLPTARGRAADYVHRCGRTGRMGNPGVVLNFFDALADAELAPMIIKMLEHYGDDVPPFLREVAERRAELVFRQMVRTTSNTRAAADGFRLPPMVEVLSEHPEFI
ncbi:RNA helicase [Aphelenchoides fujianensis]|nr:RNA helicase [Aphelenchoides fujianensis]